MKKSPFCLVMISLLLILTGCGSDSGSLGTTDPSDGNVEGENVSTDIDSTTDNYISMTSEIMELESGFSAVCYDGDYAFDFFLEQGGAASDREVLQFLTGTLLKGSSGLQIGGDVFGCSTISVENVDSGYFFGRNFDWNACDALVIAADA